MDLKHNEKEVQKKTSTYSRRTQWRFIENSPLVILHISLLISQSNCQTTVKSSHIIESKTKSELNILDKLVESNNCHSCSSSSNNVFNISKDTISLQSEKLDTDDSLDYENFIDDLFVTVGSLTDELLLRNNKTENHLKTAVEKLLDDAIAKDQFEIIKGVEIKAIESKDESNVRKSRSYKNGNAEERALFSTYTQEYRLLQKFKDFMDTHVLSISLPKTGSFFGFRSFGLKKFFFPLLLGLQLLKGAMLAMFLPSILGSFGKILGKGISTLSASSSQASYPPANIEDQDAYNADKDVMGYESDPAGTFALQDGQNMYATMADANEVNEVGNVDLSRFGSQKVAYLPSKNGYYKNQMQTAASTNYKVFQKIPASSMILSNYDPFYSPLLSRLDGIFARLGLTPSENAVDSGPQIGGQSLSDVKLEACREQLICLMYSSPAKYAPYSNLVSAQLSRELNELRRPVSDNPEILRFFRYMRAARRGQEGTDCIRAHPACSSPAATPQHTMIASYHDVNKLVTARKLNN